MNLREALQFLRGEKGEDPSLTFPGGFSWSDFVMSPETFWSPVIDKLQNGEWYASGVVESSVGDPERQIIASEWWGLLRIDPENNTARSETRLFQDLAIFAEPAPPNHRPHDKVATETLWRTLSAEIEARPSGVPIRQLCREMAMRPELAHLDPGTIERETRRIRRTRDK